MLDPEHRFFDQLPPDEQKHWASELIRCPAIAQLTPITNASYLDHPVTYLFCEGDQALPISLQQKMVQTVEDSTGVSIHKETCDAGHSPFLSQPQTIIDLVMRTLEDDD